MRSSVVTKSPESHRRPTRHLNFSDASSELKRRGSSSALHQTDGRRFKKLSHAPMFGSQQQGGEESSLKLGDDTLIPTSPQGASFLSSSSPDHRGGALALASNTNNEQEDLIERLWQTTRGSEKIFAPRHVVEPVLSEKQRQHILKCTHDLPTGGISIRNPEDFRSVIAATIGLTLSIPADEIASDILQPVARPNGNVPAEEVIKIAATMRRRAIMYEGDTMEVPGHILDKFAAEATKEDMFSASFHWMSPKQQGYSPPRKLTITQNDEEPSEHSPTPSRSHGNSPPLPDFMTPIQSPRSGGDIGQTAGHHQLAGTVLASPRQAMEDTPEQFESLLMTDSESNRLRLSQRVFDELGGDFADPGSFIPTSRAKRFITRMLSNCGESEATVEHHVASFERVYDKLNFADFDREVVEPIFLRLPKRFREAPKKKPPAVQIVGGMGGGGPSSHDHSASAAARASVVALDPEHATATRALLDDTSFVTGRSLFKTVQNLSRQRNTGRDLAKQLQHVSIVCRERNVVHKQMMENADKIFASRCTLEGTGLLHLAHLKVQLVQRYVNQLTIRRRLTVGRLNVVMGRLSRTLSQAIALMHDHHTRCTYCKETKSLTKEARSSVKKSNSVGEADPNQAQLVPRKPISKKERNRQRATHAEQQRKEEDVSMLAEFRKCHTIRQKVDLLFKKHQKVEVKQACRPGSTARKSKSVPQKSSQKPQTPRPPTRSSQYTGGVQETATTPTSTAAASESGSSPPEVPMSNNALNMWVRSVKIKENNAKVDAYRTKYPDFNFI